MMTKAHRDPMDHWLTNMLRHDRELNRLEEVPTGDDYNMIIPAGYGMLWHNCDDAVELANHMVLITAHGGVICEVRHEDGRYRVIIVIHPLEYARMLGRQPDAEEWLVL